MVEDFDVFKLEGFFLLYTLLKISRKNINSSICLTLTIINSEVPIVKIVLNTANLSKAQTLCVYKLLEVVVVSKHKNFILEAF